MLNNKMNKVKLTFIFLAFTIIPLVHGCLSYSSWSTNSQCYECTNCPNPFDKSSSQVTQRRCGISVGCAVGFFLI
jgi:hypothetical protein